MTQPEVSPDDMLTHTIDAARVAITNNANLRNAFLEASRAAQVLRDAADDIAHLRAEIVYQISVDEGLSISQVAKAIGVSKARAGQLIAAGRRTAQTPGHHLMAGGESA